MHTHSALNAIIKPKHRVILTTEQIGGDAREHFKRAKLAEPEDTNFLYTPTRTRTSDIQYIEGIDNLENGIKQLVDSIYRSDALRLIEEVVPMLSLSGKTVLSSFEASFSSPPDLPRFRRIVRRRRTEEVVLQVPDPTED